MNLARELIDDPNADADAKLLARVVLDCHDVFRIHAPVIAAAKSCIDVHGGVPRDYAARFQNELVPAVKALHRFDAAWVSK